MIKCSLHEIENLITSLKGIVFEKKPDKKQIKKKPKQKKPKQYKTKIKKKQKKKEKDTEIGEFLTLGFDSIKS